MIAQGNVYVYSSEGGSYSSATELTRVKAVAAHKGHQVLCVALSPDGRHVAAQGWRMLMLYECTLAGRNHVAAKEW
jgi:hypothetical protein